MASHIDIRPFEDADHDGVLALWARVFPEEPPWNAPAGMIARKLRVQRELFLVADHDGVIVGTVLAGYDGVRGWVHKVGVDPAFRRRGIAARLMAAAEAGLAGLGCIKLNLQVRAGNEDAERFYRSIGYDVEARTSLSKHLSAEDAAEPATLAAGTATRRTGSEGPASERLPGSGKPARTRST
jgi:ribosomal protein S18 acetylase RimI-like enzyme